MDSLVARGIVAHGCGGVIVLNPFGCSDLYARAETVPIALGADEIDQEPVIPVCGLVEERSSA